jgi:hypothetical protein
MFGELIGQGSDNDPSVWVDRLCCLRACW